MSFLDADIPPSLDDDLLSPAAREARAAIVWAEERRAMVRELAELGMAMARDLTRRALAAPEEPEPPPATAPATPVEVTAQDTASIAGQRPRRAYRGEPADTLARLTRAICMALALEAKFDKDLADLRAGRNNRTQGSRPGAPSADDGYDWDEYPLDFMSPLRNRARDNVYDVINREITDVYVAHDLLETLYARLMDGGRYEAFLRRPMKELVAAICDDLGLHPDWSRWTDAGFPPPRTDIPHFEWENMWAPFKDRIDKKRMQ